MLPPDTENCQTAIIASMLRLSSLLRTGLVMFFAALALVLWVDTAAAEGEAPAAPDSGLPLCAPSRAQPDARPVGCLRLGPAGYLERMARDGITFPLPQLSYRQIAPEMSDVGYDYMVVRDDSGASIPVYASLEDARRRRDPVDTLRTNFSYIAYRRIVEDRYVQTVSGYWVWRGDVSPVSSRPPFTGLVFDAPPRTDFGWAYDRVTPSTGPGEAFPEAAGPDLLAQQVVPVYTTRRVDGVEWYSIGPDRWVSDLHLNYVQRSAGPPPGVFGERWIEINLDEQVLVVYDLGELVFATVIASGRPPLDTQPGLFNIYIKLEADVMSGATLADGSDYYYLDRVPYTMYFDGGRALHGAYWRARLGRPQSHGCVNLAIGDARWIYEWAHLGEYVYVRDFDSPAAETAETSGGALEGGGS